MLLHNFKPVKLLECLSRITTGISEDDACPSRMLSEKIGNIIDIFFDDYPAALSG